MSSSPPPPLTKEWDSALKTVKALAEGPDAVDADSRTAALKLLWSAALGNRTPVQLSETQDLPPDTVQLIFQADNAQLAEHIARATMKAVVALGKHIEQAASTPTTTSSTSPNQPDTETAAAAVPSVTKAAVLPAVQLLTTYASVQRAWLNYHKRTRDMFSTMAIQVMVNQQLQETGLVRVLTAACPELAAAIKQQQQQPPADAESLLCTRLLAAAVLHALRRCILADRPAQIFWDEVLAPMLLPTVKLAAVCLQAYTGPLLPAAAAAAAAGDDAPASDSSPTDAAAAAAAAFDDWVQLWQEDSAVGLEPICIADHISHAITQGYNWKPQEWSNEPSLVQLLSSPELHTLLMLHTAAGVQHVQNNLRAAKQQEHSSADGKEAELHADGHEGGTQDKQQQQQQGLGGVPAWHEQVYRACGLPAGVDLTGVFVLWGEQSPSMAPVQVLGLALQMIGGGFWHPRFSQMSTSVGLLRVKEEAQQRQRQQQQQQQQQQQRRPGPFGVIGNLPDAAFVTDPDMRTALLLLLVQQLLLSPHIKRAVVNLKVIVQLATKGYCCDADELLSAAAAAAAAARQVSQDTLGQRGLEAAAALDESGPRSCPMALLVGPVLLHLGPARLDVLEGFQPSEQPDVRAEDIDAATACYASLVAVVVLADGIAHTEHLGEALKSPAAARSLELAVRGGAGNFGTVLTPDVQGFVLKPLRELYSNPTPAAAQLLPNTYLPPPGWAPSSSSAAAAADNNSPEPPKPDSLKLFSFLLSGLKFQAGVIGKAPQQPQQLSGPIELLHFCADSLALLLTMSDLNDGPGGATSVRHRWLVLAGRLLISTGQALRDVRANARSINTSIGPIPCERGCLVHWLQSTTNGISWLGASFGKLQPPAIADVETQMRLINLQQQLHMLLLQGVVPKLTPEVAECDMRTSQFISELQRLLPAGFSKQLIALGEGVCGLLPLPFCCNNASCMRCAGLGEEASVKGGRCSSCKAAHYCSASCQKQHWSGQHKTVCKKLKGQPELVAACLDAA